MLRVGGMTWRCDPSQAIGRRISDLRLNGRPIDAGRRYKVAGWAPVAEGAHGEPIWEVIGAYLREQKTIRPPTLNLPKLDGVADNPGLS